jgi:ribA/ribD-fused uncharacterized protein
MDLDNVRTREDLVQLATQGDHPQYFFFWGHRPLPNGEIGKSCLSQWWPAAFVINDVTYPTAEHFMMAEKARMFGDEAAREEILKADGPKAAKQLGRGVKNFDDARWQEHRFKFVVEGNLAKFSQNRELADFLVGTGDKVLVEASPLDRIWGIGLGANDERATAPTQWRGLNLLGFALMEVRQMLRDVRG